MKIHLVSAQHEAILRIDGRSFIQLLEPLEFRDGASMVSVYGLIRDNPDCYGRWPRFFSSDEKPVSRVIEWRTVPVAGGSRADRTRLRNQIDRLFNAHVQLISETPGRKRTISSSVADETDLWWDYKSPTQDTLWQSRVMLGERLFQEIIAHPVPLDMRILKAMRRSSLGLDLYMWLSCKTFTLLTATGPKTQRLSWHQLYAQFGKDPDKAHDKNIVNDFRKDALRELRKLRLCWPTLDFKTPKGFLEIKGCVPSIPPQAIGNNGAGKGLEGG